MRKTNPRPRFETLEPGAPSFSLPFNPGHPPMKAERNIRSLVVTIGLTAISLFFCARYDHRSVFLDSPGNPIPNFI